MQLDSARERSLPSCIRTQRGHFMLFLQMCLFTKLDGGQEKTKMMQDRTRYDKIRQDYTKNKTTQDKTRPDKTRQDKNTTQD